MSKYLDLCLYFIEWFNNQKLIQNLFWFKKNSGFRWIKGQNFGDYLSCIVVAKAARKFNLEQSNIRKTQKLLAIGSVLHFAKDGDIVWGSGINGKISPEKHTFSRLDVRMVRGPLTKKFLIDRNIYANNIFGDPALLLPYLFPALKRTPETGKILVLPNLNEIQECRQLVPQSLRFISPMCYWKTILNEILTSELVITSSLHGFIVSEAFGVPVCLVKPGGGEDLFKYEDYFMGTGRNLEANLPTFKEALILKNDRFIIKSKPNFNPKNMMEAFPKDFYK